MFASIFSFIFFTVFIALSQLCAVAEIEINKWSNDLINDSNWIHYTFKNAYENVKKSGLENFENADPNTIPITKNESKE